MTCTPTQYGWTQRPSRVHPTSCVCCLPLWEIQRRMHLIFLTCLGSSSEVWVKFRPAQSSFLLPANVEFPQFYSSFHLCFFFFVCLRLKLIGMTVTRFKCSSVIHGPCLRCMTCESRTNLTLWWPKTACSRIQKRCQRTSSHSVTHI